VRVSHTVVGGNYGSVTAAAVEVTVSDDESAEVKISPTTVAVTEDRGTGTYTVVLASEPVGGDVTVTPSSGDIDAVTVSGALTFTAGNWDTGQTVTLTGVKDDNSEADTATVSHEVAGADYGEVEAAGVEVAVRDDESAGVDIEPLALTIEEGAGTGTYTVRLDSEPAGGDVTVTPGIGGDGVATVSGALTFNAGNWSTHQTVTLTGVEDDNTEDDTATVSHEVTGADYGEVTTAVVAVTVTDNDTLSAPVTGPDSVPTFGDASVADQHYVQNTPIEALTLPAAAGGSGSLTYALSPAIDTLAPGLTFDGGTRLLSGTPTVPVSLTRLTYTATDGDGRVSAPGLMFNLSVAAVTLTIEPLVLSLAPGGSGTYTVVLNVVPTAQVRVRAMGNMPVVMPTAQAHAVNGMQTVSGLGQVLVFDKINWNMAQTVVVTAAVDASATTATISHAVSGGNYHNVHADQVQVRVTADGADAGRLHQAILAEAMHEMAHQQVDQVTRRLRRLRTDRLGWADARLDGQRTWMDLASRRAAAMADGDTDIDVKTMLGNSGFALPLSGSGARLPLLSPNVVWWGEGAYREFSGEKHGIDWDGELLSLNWGVDGNLVDWHGRHRDDLYGGWMLSWNDVQLDYEDAGSGRDGVYDLRVTSLHPYISRDLLDGRVDVWATGGYGLGHVEVTDSVGRGRSDVTFWMAALGGDGELIADAGREVRLKGRMLVTHTEVERGGSAGGVVMVGTAADTHQVQVTLEAKRSFALGAGVDWAPSAELGFRYDGGDVRNGGGLELGGGAQYRNAWRRLALSGRIRGLVGHSAGRRSWGASASLQLEGGADGQGLSVSLTPGYGHTTARAQRVWSDHFVGGDIEQDLQAHLNVRAGYGLKAFTDTGLLRPYGEMSLKGGDQRRYRLGVQWAQGARLNWELAGERREKDNPAATHSVMFKGKINL